MPRRTRKQFFLFTVIGGLQYVLDILLLYGLLLLGIDIALANLVSRGTVGFMGFAANRYVTFSDTSISLSTSLPRFLIAWAITSALSTIGILAILSLAFDGDYSVNSGVLVKIVVEVLVFIIAFLMQKLWIFPR